jgi:hypothetical protein
MKMFNHAIKRSEGGRRSAIAKFAMFPIMLALWAPTIFLSNAFSASAQDVDTSCADCPNYNGAFSIENETGVTLAYQMRWGERNPWKQFVLATGHIETHTYPLGEDKGKKIPIPVVRFDNGAGNTIEYQMDFYAVGYAGFGPSANATQPKKYFFKFGPNHKSMNLFARKF